jgi:hypothetical protein
MPVRKRRCADVKNRESSVGVEEEGVVEEEEKGVEGVDEEEEGRLWRRRNTRTS